jgi:hypothetical protein
MVIHDLHFLSVAVAPNKANTVALVDSNAVLPRSITAQFLQAVSRWHPQVAKSLCSIQEQELPKRRPPQIRPDGSTSFASEELSGLFIAEAPDHGLSITYDVNIVKRYYRDREI